MPTPSYARRREQLTTYFNGTAAATWRALTSNDPVSRIRATVRAGRDTMRATLLDWLPEDLTGRTLFDALDMMGVPDVFTPKPAGERYEEENPFDA